jgi:hypothetical protein
MKRLPLSQFESMAQRLVEDSFKRLLGGRLEPMEMAARLARALEDSQREGSAADRYAIHLNPTDISVINQDFPQLTEQLASYLNRLAQQAGIQLVSPAVVTLLEDSSITRNRMRIATEYRDRRKGMTTRLHRLEGSGEAALAALQSLDAFLIVDGRRHFPLDRPLITLGRRIENDIVLESATISRRHAQIRWRYGRVVLYDLGGRGSTLVNGQPVDESVLHPGDVISLSGVSIIYGEGRDEGYDRHMTQDPDAGPTMIMPKSDHGS